MMKFIFKKRRIKPLLFLFLALASLAYSETVFGQDVKLLSPAAAQGSELPDGWEIDYWNDETDFSAEPSSRSEHMALVISSDTLTRSRLFRKVPLVPNSIYRLSFWIKAQNVMGGRPTSGAGVRLGGLDFTPDETVKGTTNWQKQKITFSTLDDDSMVLEFLLGKQGAAKGTIQIDEIYLERISTTPFDPSVVVDLSKTRTPISDYIYGQFIEHMGNSIYGGIWAEMLEDRKFFFKPSDPRSPWEIVGDSPAVSVDSSNAFTGKYSPVITSSGSGETGLVQKNLWLKENTGYEGRIILLGDPSVLPVEVVLSWGEDSDQKETVQINKIDGRYHNYPLRFKAGVSTESGVLKIIPRGKGKLIIGTLSLMRPIISKGFALMCSP